ncbi:MAG: ABC transporter ATP-binding protein [Clostridia bacterium]|nr:ABC transporter ATP-binding protein [Clostridia bacterium]MBR2644341.1 ABC transporter ATP-binding protein [Clostridia bacterium]
MSVLEIQNLVKTYGNGPRAVDGLSLMVEAGDIYGFIGHNGAGKTTTLKCVSGILPFDEGEITIDGLSIKTQPLEAKRIMRYIPDNPDLYGFLTGVGYLNFLCDIYGIDENTRNARIAKYAAAFEIESKLGDLVSSYSHGMCQKLALIGALVQQPKLLMLDEPFVGLDPKAAHTLKGIMHELVENGSAIFFSTHVLEVAEKLCNKIAIIKQGRLIASGPMETVRGDQSLEDLFLELTDA